MSPPEFAPFKSPKPIILLIAHMWLRSIFHLHNSNAMYCIRLMWINATVLLIPSFLEVNIILHTLFKLQSFWDWVRPGATHARGHNSRCVSNSHSCSCHCHALPQPYLAFVGSTEYVCMGVTVQHRRTEVDWNLLGIFKFQIGTIQLGTRITSDMPNQQLQCVRESILQIPPL